VTGFAPAYSSSATGYYTTITSNGQLLAYSVAPTTSITGGLVTEVFEAAAPTMRPVMRAGGVVLAGIAGFVAVL
jgi:hypothetical protein